MPEHRLKVAILKRIINQVCLAVSPAAREYESFGTIIPNSAVSTWPGRFGYQGQAWLEIFSANGSQRLLLSPTRIYDPVTGRFLQNELVLRRRPRSHYNYAAGTPVTVVDPMGLQDQAWQDQMRRAIEGIQRQADPTPKNPPPPLGIDISGINNITDIPFTSPTFPTDPWARMNPWEKTDLAARILDRIIAANKDKVKKWFMDRKCMCEGQELPGTGRFQPTVLPQTWLHKDIFPALTIWGTGLTYVSNMWLSNTSLTEVVSAFAHEYTHKVCGKSEDTGVEFQKFIINWISNSPTWEYTVTQYGMTSEKWLDGQKIESYYTSFLSHYDARDYLGHSGPPLSR